MPGLFVTGSDTDCGKTEVSIGLLQALQDSGYRANAMKPVAAGAIEIDGQLVNEDAWRLQQQSTRDFEYRQVNPYLFKQPIAPHIAAAAEGVEIDLEKVRKGLADIAQQSDFVVVEGAGGWLVPMNASLDMADIAVCLNLPVILVVGLRLGCINHARLTAEAITARGCQLLGWIGSQVDAQMQQVDENIAALKHYLPAQCLGIVPFMENRDAPAIAANICQKALLETFRLPE